MVFLLEHQRRSVVDTQNNYTRLLYAGQEPWYLLDRRLSGLRSWSGRFEEETNLLSLLEFEIPERQTLRVVVIPTGSP
jgi:hypothetical protein